jgi:uncharacterized protein YjbI with pentapeptide repeats
MAAEPTGLRPDRPVPSCDAVGTQFQGADLRGAHLARASADTRWPDGFDWGAAGARLVDAC